MSHGPGGDEPDGYDPLHNFALAAAFVPTSRHATQSVVPSIVGHGQNAPLSYSQHSIPGLGLGNQSGNAAGHISWSGSFHTNEYSSFQTPLATNNSHYNTAEDTGAAASVAKRVRDACSEDGEISDDDEELDDVYEPNANRENEVNNGVMGKMVNTGAPILDTGSRKRSYGGNSSTKDRTESANDLSDSRERSGSYSPYLSPHEISQPDGAFAYIPADAVPNLASGSGSESNLVHDQHNTPPTPNVDDAKRQAKDAILRLWPLNMRFQNYLDEGIDESLLKGLFNDLGLTIPDQSKAVQKTGIKDVAASAAAPAPAPTPMLVTPVADVTKTKSQGSDSKAKEAEERKDRIARLLAQKGPKKVAVVASQTAAVPTTVQPIAKSSSSGSSGLTQSQKSKLLQEKMAALKKSREALKRDHSQLTEATPAEPNGSGRETQRTQSRENDGGNPTAISAAAAGGSNSTAGSGNEDASPPIPGLSLSQAGTAPVQNVEQLRQWSQEIKLDPPLKVAPPRPFDQNIKSRPFLIDVSDDEDDAEMEIDSPGRDESSALMMGTPPQLSAIRDVATMSDSFLARLAQSPSSIASPQRSTSRNNGGADLESMNKKIEEMKRKIAEAEARKRVKHSRQDSPSFSNRNDSSHDDASEPPSRGLASKTPSYSNLTGTHGSPRQSSLDRSRRFQAASERLPLLEARRKEQVLKLKTLQSEVARIEKELEADMMEEERLKEDLHQSGSGQDNAQTDSTPDCGDGEVEAMPVTIETAVGDSTLSDTRSDAAAPPNMEVESAALQDMSSSEDSLAEADKSEESHLASSVNDQASPDASHQMGDSEPVRATSNHSPPPPPTSDKMADSEMEDTGYSADEDMEETSDGYDPAEVEMVDTADDGNEFVATGFKHLLPVDPPDASTTAVAQVEDGGGVDEPSQSLNRESRGANGSSFMPYETPLQYFHAFRFHPSFDQSVPGGLRSLTYSNKIDVQKELCPDELAGRQCPRGAQCRFQHFDAMQAADDQILLQLGAAEDYDEQQKQEYIAGLRQLLTDFRNREVKDFNTISKGIIDYRAQFLGDKSKVLPLSGVSI